MKTLVCFSAFLACALLLAGCGGSSYHTSPGGAATASETKATVRVGDKISVQLSGVPDGGYFNEKPIPASGDISLPYLTQPIHAAGKTPAELAAEITEIYKSQKIYTNPMVTVLPGEQIIIVSGEVRSPKNVPYGPTATLISTINSCGGFTDFANRRAVRIIRGQQVLQYDAVKAINTPGADPAVYPGDQIYVPRTMF